MSFSINHIRLTHFRNYHGTSYSFDKRIVALCGLNGVGKTNLLDAVYYLCFTKSYFSKADGVSVERGSQGFNISGDFVRKNDLRTVSVILRENNKKELWCDQEQTSPFSKHIGQFPAVFIAPDDLILITGGSEERRKFIDTILSQLDQDYLTQLIRYNKCLQDRNRYLKDTAGGGLIDHLILDSLDSQMVMSGKFILDKRTIFLKRFTDVVSTLFDYIANGMELPIIEYVPSTSINNYEKDLTQSRSKDIMLQRTTVGIHRDDLKFLIHESPFKESASQGQKKSLLFALKLAEFVALKEHFGFNPILLLDDIFEKLDQERLSRLLEWVCLKNEGQVILTDTHCDRVQSSLQDISVPFQIIQL
ncbi:MAG: DNA replication/repair protein RecF [bacterium]|jgi:DNA replication and repair protein RecF